MASNAKFGSILTDGDGMTLYVPETDTAGKSTCTGSCAQNWPPLTAGGTPSAGAGAMGTLATLKRDDGSMQVTCNGAALYRFAGDKQPGDAKGQGLADKWYVVQPNCAKLEDESVKPSSSGY